mgnify:CR=1 FL=1
MEMMELILKMLGMGCLIVLAAIGLVILVACFFVIVKSLFLKK